MRSEDFHCPDCGAEVSPNARACPGCGTRREDGRWIRSEAYDGIDLPDDDFDYEAFVEREFGENRPRSPKEVFWWVVAVITLIAFAWLAFRL